MKKTLLCLLLACSVGGAHGHNGPSTTLSGASGLVAAGSVLVVAGSMSVAAASGALVVASVEVAGESVLVVLEGASEAARVTLKLSAAAAGGPAEIVEDGVTGLLTPPGDAEGLAAAVDRLLDDDALRARLGRTARDAARTRFSARGMASRFEDVYDWLITSRE